MAEKKWNDKLRQKMEGYSQTPPDGLWEAVEAGLPAPRTAFPWMWALAGVAAVALAVVLLWRPAEPAGPAVAEVTTEEVTVSADNLADETVTVEPEATENPAAVRSVAVSPNRKAATEALAEVVADNPSAVHEEAVSSVEPASDDAAADNVATDDVAGKDDAAEGDDAKVAPSPVAPENKVPVFPAEKTVIRRKPAISGSLLAGGIPGNASTSFTSYANAAPSGAGGGRMAAAALLSRNKLNQTETRYGVALRVGAMFSYSFTQHWGVESGLQLTNLQNQTRSVTGNVTTITDKTISYLGIPLLVVYTPLRLDRFSLYTSAGPMFEYGFRSFGTVKSYIGEEQVGRERIGEKESDAIISVGLNLGAQYMVTNFGGLFVQPGMSWHIAGEGNTESFYTKHPLAFSVAAGFRFNF